ncbi:MAG TPA: methionine--tRNA ligase [Candidatus Saccharimonadales bacterium]|nr:methionine--tRNA ligase [Candidatus Saccharimonadales bacterium]
MKFYVTTSIAYVNAEPHIGFGYELVLADTLARHARQKGEKTIFGTGTDEHGGKVAEKAEELGQLPKQYVDTIAKKFTDLKQLLNLSYDKFTRTTNIGHEKVAQKVWIDLSKDIYKNKYTGWYCQGDEAFFTDTVVKENEGICPTHNRPYERVSETNYFFKLSNYTKQIEHAIKSGKLRIIPETRKHEILNVIKDGLDDISISRPKEKISWGLPIPGDDDQVMYVWFEALLNYLTAVNYPNGEEFREFWPPDYQVIGKDIIRFHAAIWPGILLGLDLPLPKAIYAHGFINIDNQKISKSLGNSISVEELVDSFGTDAVRYYLLRHIPSYDDGNFSLKNLSDAYQNELGNELGNALQRTAVMINTYQGGKFEKVSNPVDNKVTSRLIEECRFDRALDEIWLLVKQLNQYIDDNKPWTLHKAGDDQKLKTVLNTQVKKLVEIAYLLQPFLPETADKINDTFKDGRVRLSQETLFPRKDLSTS